MANGRVILPAVGGGPVPRRRYGRKGRTESRGGVIQLIAGATSGFLASLAIFTRLSEMGVPCHIVVLASALLLLSFACASSLLDLDFLVEALLVRLRHMRQYCLRKREVNGADIDLNELDAEETSRAACSTPRGLRERPSRKTQNRVAKTRNRTSGVKGVSIEEKKASCTAVPKGSKAVYGSESIDIDNSIVDTNATKGNAVEAAYPTLDEKSISTLMQENEMKIRHTDQATSEYCSRCATESTDFATDSSHNSDNEEDASPLDCFELLVEGSFRRSWSDGDIPALIESFQPDEFLSGLGLCPQDCSMDGTEDRACENANRRAPVVPVLLPANQGLWVSQAIDLVAALRVAESSQSILFPAMDRSVYMNEQYFD